MITTSLSLTFYKHEVCPYFFMNSNLLIIPSNLIFLLLKACIVHLYIAFHVSLSLKDPFRSIEFYPFKWINQVSNLVII